MEHLSDPSLYKRLRILEKIISEVRKTGIPTWIHGLRTLEEISLVRQAKREHHPVSCVLETEVLMGADHPAIWEAIQDGAVDALTPCDQLGGLLSIAVDRKWVTASRKEELVSHSLLGPT